MTKRKLATHKPTSCRLHTPRSLLSDGQQPGTIGVDIFSGVVYIGVCPGNPNDPGHVFISLRQGSVIARTIYRAMGIGDPAALRQQRDDLLAACERILDAADYSASGGAADLGNRLAEIEHEARAAIAKATGKSGCPNCGAPLANDGSCCDACGWVRP